jgi:hypothetical protein
MTLYDGKLETPQGVIDLTREAATATCDTAGNLAVTKRVTVTRLVAGGIIGGLLFQKKQKHDTRELYLLVESESVASIIECDPDKGGAARGFAVEVNNAAKTAKTLPERRDQAIAAAKDRVQRASVKPGGLSEAEQRASDNRRGAPPMPESVRVKAERSKKGQSEGAASGLP